MFYSLVARTLRFIFRLMLRVEIIDLHKIPTQKPFVLVCTHSSWIDIIMLATSVYPTKINFMAKKELFKSRFLAAIFRGLKAFPVNRKSPGASSIKTSLQILNRGEVLGIFPTGTRTESLKSLKRGGVAIAQLAKVDIIPAAYWGPNNLKLSYLFSRPRAVLIFGDKIDIAEAKNNGLTRKEAQLKISDQLEQVFVDLLQKINKSKI